MSPAAMTWSLFWAQTVEFSLHWSKKKAASSTFQEVVCVPGTDEQLPACQQGKSRLLDVDQITMANSALAKKQNRFLQSPRFSSLVGYETRAREVVIHFLRHEKVISFLAVLVCLASSSSAVAQAKKFIHQGKWRSLAVLHSALQETASASFW